MIDTNKIPDYVNYTIRTIQEQGFEAFVVGGCVRDLVLGREPKDWDVTTNATPEDIVQMFKKTVYENKFGTVGVVFEDTLSGEEVLSREGITESDQNTKKDRNIRIVEVTPYRLEGKYTDYRHPESVKFSQKLEDDLKRRDFTINAMAFDPLVDGGEEMSVIKDSAGRTSDSVNTDVLNKGRLVDIYSGLNDLKDKVLKTVGAPDERFTEDALRMLRAIRFSTALGFAIDTDTLSSITKNRELLAHISAERIRDEFEKIIMSDNPSFGIKLMQKSGILKYVVPELEEGVGCEQKGEHIYDVFDHMLHALNHASEKSWPLHIRLAALFHDIGKPRTRRWDGTKAGGQGKYTFYGHEVVGARMAKVIMERLKFPKDLSELVVKLVRYHMFFSDTETITLSAVRRTIVNVGRENIWDLMNIRECDRVGMKKKEAPYRLRKYHAMIEEALRAPTSVGMLKIDGTYMMKEVAIKPGPRMGWMLHALLEECLEDDSKNTLEYLKDRVSELDKLSDKELKALGEKGKEAREKTEEEELGEIRKKHGVK